MKDLPTNYTDACKDGAKYYFTGKRCKRDHLDKRSTQSRACVSCRATYKDMYAGYRKTDKYKEYQKNYQAEYAASPKGKAARHAAYIRWRKRVLDAKQG